MFAGRDQAGARGASFSCPGLEGGPSRALNSNVRWLNNMALPHPPANWDREEIPRFIDAARNNEFATFANKYPEVSRLSDLDIAFRKAIDSLHNSKDWFAAFFLLRAHSNLLGACRLSWSGQNPEAYALLRSCLENALYGLYFAKKPDSRETWLKRHDSEESKRAVRNKLTIKALLSLAEAVSPTEGAVARILYERTIDMGAHPNELALMQALHMSEGDNRIGFQIQYLSNSPAVLDASLKTTAQVGACALSLFTPVFSERFQIIGVIDMLNHIKVGL